MKSNIHKIEHVVVLMLENRSFDNILGWLGSSNGGKQKVNGVAGKKLSNPIPPYVEHPTGIKSVPVGKETVMTNPSPDPGEEYPHVNTQLYGHIIPEENMFPPFNQPPYNLRPGKALPKKAPMNGFVTDYINTYASLRGRLPTYEEYKVVMNCFDEDAVPVLSTLAKEYAVFDAWFSSVPSHTFCNRSFMHAATSHGYVINSPFYHWLMHGTQTIFNRIDDKKNPDITWKVYYDKLDLVSLTGLQNPTLWHDRKSNFQYMDDFYNDAKCGTLPSYSFIDPRIFVDHNDQHPPLGPTLLEKSSVLAGELLIHDVYCAVRSGLAWNKTLLIITYDEHGGCYDHVSPPAAVPPDPRKPKGQMDFKFDRLGVRVPMVMVSPYIEPGTVISDVHDHTSILKLVETRWNLEPLTDRDKKAPDFSKVLNREWPRELRDCPETHPRPYTLSKKSLDAPINDLQKGMLMIIAGFEDARQAQYDSNIFEKATDILRLVLDEKRIVHIKTVRQAIKFSMDFDRRTSKRISLWERLWITLKLAFLPQET